MDGSKHRGDERHAGGKNAWNRRGVVCDDVHQGVGGAVDDDGDDDGVFGRARVVAETRRAETRQTRETHRDHEMGHDLAYEETKGLETHARCVSENSGEFDACL